jgi:hypothetical protein
MTQKKTNLETTPIMVELSTGASLPLRPIKAKSGNVYHAILKAKADGSKYNPGPRGQKVAPSVVGGDLPDTVKVAGETIKMDAGTTKDKGNRKVSCSQKVNVEGLGERVVRLHISALPDGTFNVSGSLNRPGGSAQVAATAL